MGQKKKRKKTEWIKSGRGEEEKKRREFKKVEIKKRGRGSKKGRERERGMEERKSREERSLWIQYRCRVLVGNTVLLASATRPTPMIHHLIHCSLLDGADSGPPRPSAVGARIGDAEYFIRYHTCKYCWVPACTECSDVITEYWHKYKCE